MNQPTAQFYRVTTDDSLPVPDLRSAAGQLGGAHRFPIARPTDSSPTTIGRARRAARVPTWRRIPATTTSSTAEATAGFLTRYNHDLDMNRAINVWPDNPWAVAQKACATASNGTSRCSFHRTNSEHLYTSSQHSAPVHQRRRKTWDIISPDLTRGEGGEARLLGRPHHEGQHGRGILRDRLCRCGITARTRPDLGRIR